MKIDVEGYEAEVLRGGVCTIERLRPLVSGEFHNGLMSGHGDSFHDVWPTFEPLDYRCFSFHGRMSLVAQPAPSARLGNAVLCPAERVAGLLAAGVHIDETSSS